MARRPRPFAPGVPQHLISRFLNREFRLTRARDRDEYARRVGEAFGKSDAKFCAFANMGNHTHNVVVGGHERLGSLLHTAHTGFGLWWNKTNGGLGRVFAERPKSILIDTEEGLANVIAYGHNNPGRAGLVDCPSQSDLTSHPIYLGLKPCPEYLDVEWALAEMGFSASPSGRLAFHEFVCSRMGLGRDPTLSGPGKPSLEQAKKLFTKAARFFGIGCARLARPRSCEDELCRLVFLATALELFGETAKNLASAMGLSTGRLSRLRRECRGYESLVLVEALIER